MEYIILSDSFKSILAIEVNKYIKMGWILQGGISSNITLVSSVIITQYTQAMVKHENKTSEIQEKNP